MATGQSVKLSSDVHRVLFVKNLNYKTTGDDIYDLFGVRLRPPVLTGSSGMLTSSRRDFANYSATARSGKCG